MFTQQCYIKKNSKELREKLNAIGYKLNHGKAWEKYLCVFKTEDTKEWVYVASPFWDLKNMPNIENSIDCGENEELFLAIAALRDDRDYMQWFTDGAQWTLWNLNTFNGVDSCLTFGMYKEDEMQPHKATVEELIEHFK